MPALRDETRHHLLPERFAMYDHARCLGTPEMEEMRLSAARRPMQGKGSGGPILPSVYPGNGCGVAVRNQEIGAAQSGATGQIEGELHRYPGTPIRPVTSTSAPPSTFIVPAPSARGCVPTAGDRSIPKRP